MEMLGRQGKSWLLQCWGKGSRTVVAVGTALEKQGNRLSIRGGEHRCANPYKAIYELESCHECMGLRGVQISTMPEIMLSKIEDLGGWVGGWAGQAYSIEFRNVSKEEGGEVLQRTRYLVLAVRLGDGGYRPAIRKKVKKDRSNVMKLVGEWSAKSDTPRIESAARRQHASRPNR